MKRHVLLLPLLLPMVAAGQAGAVTTSFSQRILPLNCIFETIDVGTGTLRYLTPAECGVLVPHGQTGDAQSACDSKMASAGVACSLPTGNNQSVVELVAPVHTTAGVPTGTGHITDNLTPLSESRLQVSGTANPVRRGQTGMRLETVAFVAGSVLAVVLGILILFVVL